MPRCSLHILEQWASQTTPISPSSLTRIFSPWLSVKTSPRKTCQSSILATSRPQCRTHVTQARTTSSRKSSTSVHGDIQGTNFKSSASLAPHDLERRGIHITHQHNQAGHAAKAEHTVKSNDYVGENVKRDVQVDNSINVLGTLSGTLTAEPKEPSRNIIMTPEEAWNLVRHRLHTKVNEKLRRATGYNMSEAESSDSGLVPVAPQTLAENIAGQGGARKPLNTDDKLGLAYEMTKQGDMTNTGEIIELLRTILLAGHDAEDIRVLKMASLLLRRSKGAGGQYHDSSTIVAALSDIGVRLNLTMFNVLMLNAAEMNDPATAWRIYDLIFDNGVQPDTFTNVILLSMCRKTNDKASYKALYRGIKPEQRQLALRLATEIMLCRYHFNARENFEHILRFYELHFDLEPLRALRIVTPEMERMLVTRERNENNPKMQPSPTALSIIIRIYARRTQVQQPVRRVYDAFQEQLIKLNPLVLPLVTTTHVYNVFLKAICRTSNTVLNWRSIVTDMKRSLPTMPAAAAPDLQTWNIILNSCMACEFHDEARKVWNTMRAEGHTPDAISWNTRLDGLSKKQDTAGVADTLKRMIAAGIEADDFTKKALNRIRDQQLLHHTILHGKWGSLDRWGATLKVDQLRHEEKIGSAANEQQAKSEEAYSLPLTIRSTFPGQRLTAAELVLLARQAVEDYRVEKRKKRHTLTSTSKNFERLELVQQLNRFRKYYFHGWRYRLRGRKDPAKSTNEKLVSNAASQPQAKRASTRVRTSRHMSSTRRPGGAQS